MAFNWQLEDWPDFKYNLSKLENHFFQFIEQVGRVSGLLKGLPDKIQNQAILDLMVSEAIKTSEIEGEYISRKDVMSSIRNNLGLTRKPEQVKDLRAQGAAELMIDIRNTFKEDLTEEKLFSWHQMVMKGNRGLTIGHWRDHEEPMQVVSGALGKEKVHYEAPPSKRVPEEMKTFIEWFNATGPNGEKNIHQPIVRAAIAHLYFESIHPFEDGNGRIGRAISEKALSQHIKRPVLLSLSKTIEANKNDYYEALMKAQRSIVITPWLAYFVKTTLEAQNEAEKMIDFTLNKTRFFDQFESQLNERQLKVIRRMLKEGPNGFEGGMSAKKYSAITKTSKATATRDLQDLTDKNVFIPFGAGRSTKYNLNLDKA